MRERELYARRGIRINWRLKKNYLTKVLENSKKVYFKNLIDANKNDKNNIWSIIREIFPQQTCRIA